MIKPGMYISDRYEIIDKVGSGGMADVYKARCHRLNRFVAIKILKSEYSDDKSFVVKFRAEAQSAAGLSHPNIVNVYDVGEDDGLYYIVMELVEGITLKNFIERKGKIEVREAIGISLQISQGMEAAHANHIIHRDIKPQNIIISKQGKVKVTDFGIAKAASSNTITSNAMGSVHYISPEQARGGFCDEKSDIYSLGITMYEMLTGNVPFIGDNTVSVALAHIQDEATPLEEIDVTIPISVDRIVQKCMQKKPERRYFSVTELIVDLRKSLSNPNGDFVKMDSGTVAVDSPTISITPEETKIIKDAAKIPPVIYNTEYEDKLEKTIVAAKQSNYNTPASENEEISSREQEIYSKNQEIPSRNQEVSSESQQSLPEVPEESSDVDPKLEKFMVIGSVVVAVILALIILFLVGRAFGIFNLSSNPPISSNEPEEEDEPSETKKAKPTSTVEATPTVTPIDSLVAVPNFMGRDLEESQTIAKEKILSLRYEEDYHDTVPKGLIYLQDPVSGTEVEENTIVNVSISLGPKTFEIPDVINQTDEKAMSILSDLDVTITHAASEYHDTIPKGSVVRTSPVSGTQVKKGSTITLVLSLGKEIKQVAVPNLYNLTEADARIQLLDSDLKVDSSQWKHSNIDEGKVIDQDYKPGTMVSEGTMISIILSLGPETTPIPTPTLTPTPEPQVQYTYKGTVKITENPFKNEQEQGVIVLELEQDGEVEDVYEAMLGYNNFPFTKEITGFSESDGTIRMYLDGVICDGQWVISFSKVPQ